MNTLSITIDIEDWYHKTFLQAKSFTKKTFIDKWTGKYDYLSLRKQTKRVLDMLDSLEKIGFKYDSSVCVNSLYNMTDSSLEGVSSYPYYTKDEIEVIKVDGYSTE